MFPLKRSNGVELSRWTAGSGGRLAFCGSKVSYFVKIETLLHPRRPCALVYFTCAAPFSRNSARTVFVFPLSLSLSLFFYYAPRRICPFSFIVISIAVDGVSIVFGSISISSRLRSIPAGPEYTFEAGLYPGESILRCSAARTAGRTKKCSSPGCTVRERLSETRDERRTDGRADGWTRVDGRTV